MLESLAARFSVEDLIPLVLPLVQEAGWPYLDWLFGGRQATEALLERWMRRSSSEYSIERIQAFFDGDALIGAYWALSGRELHHCRKADAVAAVRDWNHRRSELLERLQERRAMFPPVLDQAYYLSNVAVVPAYRGRGVGRSLLEAYIERGTRLGHHRFRLDANAENTPAIRLYESLGFDVIHEHTSHASRARYLSMVLITAPAS